jgi:hypothetical protein
MKSFKEFYLESKIVFSPKEPISIVDVGDFTAKIDSGNDAYGVLHGDNIKTDEDEKQVSFVTSDGKTIVKPLVDTIKINVGAGVEENRPIVHFDFVLKGKEYKNQKFSIGNRTDNEEKVLIGLKFLEPLKASIQC